MCPLQEATCREHASVCEERNDLERLMDPLKRGEGRGDMFLWIVCVNTLRPSENLSKNFPGKVWLSCDSTSRNARGYTDPFLRPPQGPDVRHPKIVIFRRRDAAARAH